MRDFPFADVNLAIFCMGFVCRRIRQLLRRQFFAKTAKSAKIDLAKINLLKVYEN